jgi:hemerythrin-like domain-containing protein
MDQSEIGAWMKEEYAKVNELARRLRELIFDVPSGDLTTWLTELGQRFDHFAAHYRRMMNLTEEGGYLLPVVERRPALLKQVELLRHEQDELRRLMDDLHNAIQALRPEDQLLIRDCCARLQGFLGHVQRHQEHEHHIVLYALTQETGSND